MPEEIDYLVYCIENYSVAKGMKPSDVASLFERTGADAYIKANYGALHLTGPAYMVDDVDCFMANHRDVKPCGRLT